MSSASGDQEARWAAEERDFVADGRDEVADERDRVGGSRDRTADGREAELEEKERPLDGRGPEFGGPARRVGHRLSGPGPCRTVAGRAGGDKARTERSVAAAERGEPTKRRQAAAPSTRLATAFAELAEQFYDAADVDEVLSRITKAAVLTVAGCEMASVTLAGADRVPNRSVHGSGGNGGGSSAVSVAEGTCLDAIDASMVYAQSFPDERWPNLASRPTEAGVQSALSYPWLRRGAVAWTQVVEP